MKKRVFALLLLIVMLMGGCAASQPQDTALLHAEGAQQDRRQRRFARPRPYIGFPYAGGFIGGIGGVGVGGACR